MNNRFSSTQFGKVVLALSLVLGIAFIGAGCSSGGGSSSSDANVNGNIKLSGAVGTGYQAAAKMKSGFFAKIFTTIGFGTPAYAALTDPTVDQVVAIPMERGSLAAFNMRDSVASSINADKTFSLLLPVDRDWLLVMINSAETGTNRFVGSLALNTGGADSLLNIPVTQATFTTMNLGIISRDTSTTGNDAISQNTVTALDFNLTAGQLATMAKTDDIFRNAKNIINNYNPATGIYHEMRTDFHWSGNYGGLTSLSTPSYTSIGVSFQQDTNSTGVTMSGLCNGTDTVEFVPSEVVSNGVTTFGPTAPISSIGMTCMNIMMNGGTFQQTSTGSGGNVFASNAYGNLSYGPYGRYTVLPARWDVKENGVVKAQFDMAAAHPPQTADGRPKGYVPSFKINVDGTKKITSVDVAWYYYDEASDSYIAMAQADLKLLEHVIKAVEVKFDVTTTTTRKSCDMYFDPTTVFSAIPSNPVYNCPDSWYYNDATHPATNTGLMGFYETGGFGYFYDFFLP